MTIDKCCFCDAPASEIEVRQGGLGSLGNDVTCWRCGRYGVSDIDIPELRGRSDRHRIAMRLRARKIRGLLPVILSSKLTTPPNDRWVVQSVDEVAPPADLRVGQRFDEALINLGHMSEGLGHPVRLKLEQEATVLWADDRRGADAIVGALAELGLVKDLRRGDKQAQFAVMLTPKGWARFEDLTIGAIGTDPPTAFVAMWFDESLLAVWKDAIEPAIKAAGYQAIRVDLSHHNGLIEDQIIALIRAAPFVLADFTNHREGVYFEAGYALGLGKQVVFTVRQDDLDKAHFDTSHRNHIAWHADRLDEFRTAITNRILATVGRPRASRGASGLANASG